MPSGLGFQYERGLRVIERTYEAAQKSLIDQKYHCYTQLEAIRRDELSSEYDRENGEYSPEAIIEYEIDEIAASLQNLRQAMLLVSYHFWEKQVRNWAGKPPEQGRLSPHDAGVNYCEENGLDVDRQRMGQLRLLVNLIKHSQGKGDWGDKLWHERAELFASETQSTDPADFLDISVEILVEFFNAIRRSGPRAGGCFAPRPLT